jgi:hypothetical protein
MRERIVLGTKDNLRVQMSPKAIQKLGEPSVNYDGLLDLFHGHFGVASEAPVTTDLYAGSRIRMGYCNPFVPDTMHINVTTTEPKGLTTAALLHEGKHLADRNNQPARYLGLTMLRVGIDTSALSPAWVTATTGSNVAIPVAQVAAGLAVGFLYNTRIDPLEVAALRVGQDAELLERYTNLVVFPNSAASQE